MGKFDGIVTALVTPLHADGTVDEQGMIDLVEYQIQHKVNALLLLGGTGEYTSMTMEERFHAMDVCAKAVNKRVPLMVGVLEPGIGECLKYCRYCKEHGADALLVLTPFYFMGTQDAVVEFYKTVDRELDMPILVYNIPYRTNVNVTPDMLVRLTKEMKNLVGVKECGPMSQAMEDLAKVGDKIDVLSGDEFSAISLMAMGAKGAIMATANVVPDAWVRMYELVKEGNVTEALAMTMDYFMFFKALFSETYVSPLKYAMVKKGVPGGSEDVLLPLLHSMPETKKWVDAEMKRLKLV